MLVRALATIQRVVPHSSDAVVVDTEFGPAIAYTDIVGQVLVGDTVVVNRTSNVLGLGTGGFDFVMAIVRQDSSSNQVSRGHVMKLRYSPSQLSVQTLEERAELSNVWERELDGFPVVVCQLHSQIAHVAAAVADAGRRVVYVMTDTGALASSFSRLVRDLKAKDVVAATITCGQSFGGDYEAVTVHSALLAAKHFLGADVAVVGQGPGNAGTSTKYGFGGIEQASLLDIAAALGGRPVAVVRASRADGRPRHQGISHHTLTSLHLVRSACTIPVPAGMITTELEKRHTVIEIPGLESPFEYLDRLGVDVTSMGRGPQLDRLFFECAAAAGVFAARLGE